MRSTTAMFSLVSNACDPGCHTLILPADDSTKDEVEVVASLGEFCVHIHYIVLDDEAYYVGLSKTGNIHVSKSKMNSALLSTGATSLAVASDFLIFTTTTHEAIFVPFSSLPSLLSSTQLPHGSETAVLGPTREIPASWSTRKVERGSRIVVAVPSNMSLVLQMPRGNLETINPRPLVMEVVKQDLDAYAFFQSNMKCH